MVTEKQRESEKYNPQQKELKHHIHALQRFSMNKLLLFFWGRNWGQFLVSNIYVVPSVSYDAAFSLCGADACCTV